MEASLGPRSDVHNKQMFILSGRNFVHNKQTLLYSKTVHVNVLSNERKHFVSQLLRANIFGQIEYQNICTQFRTALSTSTLN